MAGSNQVGGLVGHNWRGSVAGSLAAEVVTGSERVGGLAGRAGTHVLRQGEEAIIQNSYYDNQTTNQTAAVGVIEQGNGTAETRGEVTGLPTSQAQGGSAATSVTAFDFAETWQIVANPDDYPVLRALQADTPPASPVAPYANEDGVVDIDRLLDAIADFRSDEIGVALLVEAIDAFRNGAPVT